MWFLHFFAFPVFCFVCFSGFLLLCLFFLIVLWFPLAFQFSSFFFLVCLYGSLWYIVTSNILPILVTIHASLFSFCFVRFSVSCFSVALAFGTSAARSALLFYWTECNQKTSNSLN